MNLYPHQIRAAEELTKLDFAVVESEMGAGARPAMAAAMIVADDWLVVTAPVLHLVWAQDMAEAGAKGQVITEKMFRSSTWFDENVIIEFPSNGPLMRKALREHLPNAKRIWCRPKSIGYIPPDGRCYKIVHMDVKGGPL